MIKNKIKILKKTLDMALNIDEKKLAEKIKSKGFRCQKCSQCCMGEYGDNTVAVFPFEIRCISEKMGLMWHDIAIPTPSEDKDSNGKIHTFEWVLKNNGNCAFLKNGLCEIYKHRPYICSTYPFYLVDSKLMVCDCKGLGYEISKDESLNLAFHLKERYIIEIKEGILLFEKFRGFENGKGDICVHDSEGEHWIWKKN